MPGISVTDVYDTVLTTSLREYIPKMHDNTFMKVPFYMWLYTKGKVKRLDGGYEVIVPVMYQGNSTVGWYSGYDELDTSPQDPATVARYGWRQFAVSIAVDRLSERRNAGKHKIVSLMETLTQQAEGSLRKEMALRLFAGYSTSTYTTYDPSGTSWDTAKPLPSLQAFIPKAATAASVGDTRTAGDYGTIGYLNGEATYQTWWRSNQWAYTNVTTAADTSAAMGQVYNTCYKGSVTGYPDLILSNQEFYQWYEACNTGYITYTDKSIADLGFQNLRYKGATMMWDPHHEGLRANDECCVYFINSDHFYLVVDAETDFITTPFYRPTNQDARVAQILWMGTLVCNNRRGLGVLQAYS